MGQHRSTPTSPRHARPRNRPPIRINATPRSAVAGAIAAATAASMPAIALASMGGRAPEQAHDDTVTTQPLTLPVPVTVDVRPGFDPNRPGFKLDDGIPYVDDGKGDPGDLSTRGEKDGVEPVHPPAVLCVDPNKVTPLGAEGTVSQEFHPGHNGIDVAADYGTPILAAMDGTVIDAGPAQGFGTWIRIQHNDGTITVYGHQSANHVAVGDHVEAGQHIADVGSQGDSTGPHLHFEVWIGGEPVDPWTWLQDAADNVGCNPNAPAPSSSRDESPPPATHDWDGVAKCESGGDWTSNTGYYDGGLQFDPNTWAAYGGTVYAPTADQATKDQQIIVAERVLRDQGIGAWPTCGQYLQPGTGGATVTAASTVGEQALAAGLTQQGVMYTWGGSDPSTGFDCSGLVVWSFRQAGLDVPRVTAADMASWGTSVNLADIAPGDIVISNGGGHVGIYAGIVDGVPQLLNAPTFGEPVQLNPLDWFTASLVTIRRMSI